MEELPAFLTGGFGIVVLLFLLVWAVLMFLLPFFVYGAWQRAKEISQKMDRVIQALPSPVPARNLDYSDEELEAMGAGPAKKD